MKAMNMNAYGAGTMDATCTMCIVITQAAGSVRADGVIKTGGVRALRI